MFCQFRFLPSTYNIRQHIHESSPDGFRVSTVGLPSSSGDGQMSVSKTASTIVRNSNAAASAVDYANGSGLPFKTISVDADLSSVHATPTDPSSNMTGETLYNMSHDVIIFTYTNYTSCQSHVYYNIPPGYYGHVYCIPIYRLPQFYLPQC